MSIISIDIIRKENVVHILPRTQSIRIETANMHCKGIVCTRLFYMSLTSAYGQKLVFLNKEEKIFYMYYEIWLTHVNQCVVEAVSNCILRFLYV